jgi:small GTP-binding protein
VQFVEAVFLDRYDPTIEDSYRKIIERRADGKEDVALDILDTAGTEQFTAMRDMYMKSGDAFLLVYAITSPDTFHELVGLRDRLVRVKPGAKFVLVGNKSDLGRERVVSRAAGEGVAVEWGCPFVETSARDPASVSNAFSTLIDELEQPSTVSNCSELHESMRAFKSCKKRNNKKCIIT